MPWWTSTRNRVRLVAPVTALILLAGCTGGPPAATESSTPPAVTSTPTPTPTPTEVPGGDVTVKPERPAALDQPPSVEGAVAVAEYYLRLYPYVNATGDLSDWDLLRHSDCNFCTGVADAVAAKIAAGRHDVGGNFDISSSTGSEVDTGVWFTVEIDLVQHPSTTVDATGSVVETFPDTKQVQADMVVIHEAGSWKIRGADVHETAP